MRRRAKGVIDGRVLLCMNRKVMFTLHLPKLKNSGSAEQGRAKAFSVPRQRCRYLGRQRRCGPAVRRPARRRNPIRTARKDGIQTYMYTNYLFSSDTEDSHVGRCILSNLLHFHLFLLEGFRIFRCRLRAGYDTLPEMCRERKCF
jgi:hypothetical protein